MRYRISVAALLLAGAWTLASQTGKDWQSVFSVDKKTLGVKGSNPFFVLTPGYRLTYRHGKDSVSDTVLDETATIDGVECRVIEDRETKNGQLVELTRDYYAIDSGTNDVYYFGEDVDAYKNGTVTGHGGSWRSGVKGARFGLMMPGVPKAGQRFYQEWAPGAGMDRAEILGLQERTTTPAGTFENCVHTRETSAIEKGSEEKWYAPGIGPVRDAEMLLVEYGKK